MWLPWNRSKREQAAYWKRYWEDEPLRRAAHHEFVEWMVAFVECIYKARHPLGDSCYKEVPSASV